MTHNETRVTNSRFAGSGLNRSNRTRQLSQLVQVRSAVPLTRENLHELKRRLAPVMGDDSDLDLAVDPKLLAGASIRIGDTIVDFTLARFLRSLRRRMRQAALPDGPEGCTAAGIRAVLRQVIEDYKPVLESDDVGTVLSVGDGVARLSGLRRAMLGELVLFSNDVQGMVLDLGEDDIGCVLFADDDKITAGDTAMLTGRVVEVPVGEALKGRVVNALGQPIDDKGPIQTSKFRPIESDAPGIADREKVSEPLPTGIKAIDALIPLGKGQRELIVGDRQTGKTAIAIDTIINQKGKDVVCVYVAIGQKAATISHVVSVLEQFDAMSYTVVVSASASENAAMQYIAPYAGCAIAEEFMENGRDVLIVYDDLSKHAVAYRAMSLLLRRPPGREAYPGDIFYLHARLLERAAKLRKDLGGGSMTALAIVETQAGDLSAYIPTNLISITDGQIFLESELFFSGVRPAINVGLSVSRVGGDAQIPAMKKVAGALRLELAQYREIESFAQFGADLDKFTQMQLRRGERIVEVLKQPQYSPVDQAEQVVLLFAVSQRLLDDIPVDQVRWFEHQLSLYMNENHPELLRHIRQTGEIDDIVDELREAIVEVKASLGLSRESGGDMNADPRRDSAQDQEH